MLVCKDHDRHRSLPTKVSVSYELCSFNFQLLPFLGTVKLRESSLTALNNIDTLTLAPLTAPSRAGGFPEPVLAPHTCLAAPRVVDCGDLTSCCCGAVVAVVAARGN